MIGFSSVVTASLVVLLTSRQVFATPSPLEPSSLHGLLARQFDGELDSSEIPEQCKPACSSIYDAIAKCTSVDCICTDKNAGQITSCLACAVGLEGSEVTVAQAQTGVDQFIASCKAGGADLKSQSVADAQKSNSNGASHTKPAFIGAALAMSALYLFN
ncbi:hypothetical protein PLEOSDRAFT_1090340 [Pleurotus ostreatus PC15]|uniref:Extracellular membrane protein CFEM domain-containing protein n=1 Tax=Pleurotus ostreatus (strain PC15) TaxID=1137138 RepID=A0A067N9H3_PLEO1|nr:hypothetical protein PLEOSDRAFT_1090340 [Pleurotus ostreatus PC15]